jgi:hypothetical protein
MRRPLTRADTGQAKAKTRAQSQRPLSGPQMRSAHAFSPARVDRDTGAAFAEVQADAITELDAAVIPQAINGSTVFR